MAESPWGLSPFKVRERSIARASKSAIVKYSNKRKRILH
ncbi:hypothetical protein ZEAMMB73_Zm00001d003475 [Zea mays]|uniref:Uncharacterized protein n=1 Tax=Zea mays TaxID=4577 RepID=A0A1D6E9D0_MAIZE|nr:hypothetical protein ZEAMMB73_Zm00001d003475 [Zea mays]